MKELKIALILFVFIAISYGTIIYIQLKVAEALMEKANNEIKKAIGTSKFKSQKPYRLYKTKKRKKIRKRRVWVAGKSLKECMKYNKVIDNNTVRCRNGYYKELK